MIHSKAMHNSRVLIVDDVHEIMLHRFNEAGIVYDYQPNCTLEEALDQVSLYNGLVVRSKFHIGELFISRAKNLQVIGRPGAGMDNIDEVAAYKYGVTLINAPEGNRDAVGEHVIGSLLSMMNHLNRGNLQVKSGQWLREENRGWELKGKTVGLIGCGNNGMSTAKKLSGFDVEVLAYDKYKSNFSTDFVREVNLATIFEKADVLSLHVPLTKETENMVNKIFIDSFKKPFFLVNAARGAIVDIPALLEGLGNNSVVAAALDVLPIEKFPNLSVTDWYSELIKRENVFLTPHVAGWTFASHYKLSEILANKICVYYQNRYKKPV